MVSNRHNITQFQVVIDPNSKIPFSLMAYYCEWDNVHPDVGWNFYGGFCRFTPKSYWFCRDMGERFSKLFRVPLLEDKFIPCEAK